MKKISFVFVTMMTVLLSGLLMACSFKKAEAVFSDDEITCSLNAEINISDFLEVKGVDETEVSFGFSNPSLFEVNGGNIKAIASGKSIVYATYQNNSLDSMQIVVKKKFATPSNFNIADGVLQSAEGNLTWDVVADFFDGDVAKTSARTYSVVGTYTTNDGKTKQFSSNPSENSCKITDEGVYSLNIVADAYGYFDTSAEALVEFSYGLSEVPAESTLAFSSNGVFSWGAVENSKYKVMLDGKLLGDYQTTTSKDVSQYLNNADAGEHKLSVVVFDTVGTQLPNQSKEITIQKLSTPTVSYDTTEGGKIKVGYIENAESYVFTFVNLSNSNETQVTISADEFDIISSFNGLNSGVYKLSVVAKTNVKNCYQSSASDKIGEQENLIYKLPTINSFVGLGGNELNGNIFKAKIGSEKSLFDTSIKLSGIDHDLLEGLSVDEDQKELEISISAADSYVLGATLLPAELENVYAGENIFVINSDECDKISVVKLDFVSEIEHKYVDEKSVFVFDKVENAAEYVIEVDNVELQLPEESFKEVDGKIEVAFGGKIDTLFNLYEFKFYAKGADEKLSINATKTKNLAVLEAPTAVTRDDVADKKYVWNEVENASGYRLEIYSLDKTNYDKFVGGNIDLTGLSATTKLVNASEYTFEKEGYYYVNVYALTGDENLYLDSQNCLAETLCVAEKLTLSDINLGFDASYPEQNPTTGASGYFVRIAKTDYVTKYLVSVGGAEQTIDISTSEDAWTDLWLTETFSGDPVEISVIAKADDETVYLASDAKVVVIERLKSITYDSFSNGQASIDELTTNVTVKAVEGAREIKIVRDVNNKASGDSTTDAVYPIGKESNFELSFEVLGTQLGADKLYEGERVYLDASETTLRFTRHATPTEFEFNSEKLIFVDSQTALTNVYVLDLNCKTVNGDNFQIKIEFGPLFATATYEGIEVPIGTTTTLRSIDSATHKVTIHLNKILNIVNLSEDLKDIYAQSVAVEFEVYVYKSAKSADGSYYEISSLMATLKDDSTKSNLVVEKMASPTLEFEGESATNYTLKWNAVTVDNQEKNGATVYEIYSTSNSEPIDGTLLTEAEGIYAFEFSKTGYAVSQFYSFYVVATNPYYLSSNNSNLLRIYKLASLKDVKVKTDGKVELLISSLEKDFVSGADVNSVEYNTYTEIPVTGTSLNVKLIGKTESFANVVTTYIDSDVSSWTLTQLSTLAPADTTLSYNDSGDLTWNKFGTVAGLNSLKYRVYFKDETGAVIYHDVTENKINVLNDEVYDKISAGLKEGTIEVQVVAYLADYTVTSGGTIYYSAVQSALGAEMNNAFIYGTKQIIKLTTPEVTNVEFESIDFEDSTYPDFEEKTLTFDAQNPTMTVRFEGNYGASVDVMAYVNETTLMFEGAISKTAEGDYAFDVDKAWYDFDENGIMTISIKATVAGTIPSSLGSVEVSRAADLASIEFVEVENNYTTDLKITLGDDGNTAVGGIVLKLDYVDNDNNSKVLYTLANITNGTELVVDLQDFMEENLSNGGVIRVTAFTNNNSDSANGEYYLPSENNISTEELEILRTVKEGEVVRSAGGFIIYTNNGYGCTYVVEYGEQKFEITSEDNFYFEFPDEWMNGTYDLVVYAKEDGKITSAKANISFDLSRVSVVDKATIALERDDSDKSKVTLSWGAVSGATSYLFRVYNKEDDKLIYETTLETAGAGTEQYLLSDIFGDSYAKIEDFGALENPIDFFKADQNLTFKIVAIGNGTTTNNSKITSLDVVLQGNALLGIVDATEILMVDELGRLEFVGEDGEEYLYEFHADEAEYQPWKEVLAEDRAVLIDATEFSKLVPNYYFSIKLANKGDESAFGLDSYVWSSRNTMLNLRFNAAITKAYYNENVVSGVALEVLADSFTTLYVGANEEALYNGQVASVKYAATKVSASDNTNVVYTSTFADIIEAFEGNGLAFEKEGDVAKVYFWVYLAENQDGTATMLNSRPTEFSFELTSVSNFEEITKLGEVVEGEHVTSHDYANVYANFTNQDVEGDISTLGMFVKVEDDSLEEPVIKFLSAEQIKAESDKFSINITKIFEESDLVELCGEFLVSFASLQVRADGSFVMTDWFSGDAESFVFTRLDPVTAVRLVEGNVHWTGYEGGKYYVYFIEELDETTLELGETFDFSPTDSNFFDASNFLSVNKTYFIAVQAYSGDAENMNKFVLPSKRVFVSEYEEETLVPAEIYKNQVNSPLILKDGQLLIEWPNLSEILEILLQANPSGKDIITEKPFTSPFTFTIDDLLNGELIFRLKFTSTGDKAGITKSFDVDARHILSSLFEKVPVIEEILTKLYDKEQDDLIRSRLRSFIEYCNTATYGVANSRLLFDEIFETLQVGSYSLKYCLLGGSSTVNSSWYEFKNEKNENVVYVNAQPTIKVTKKETADKTINNYRVFIKRSYITEYNDETNAYEQVLAENYVMKLAAGQDKYVFNISKGVDKYSLTMQDSEISSSITVYQTDADGVEVKDAEGNLNGEYLMFYINHNEGNSLLGVYGEEIVKKAYDMQIYAVGNNVSMSSKSQYHSLTFLSFGDNVSIIDGEFVWTPHLRRTTTVVYKRTNTGEIPVEVDLSSDLYYSRFSLDSGEGYYEYVKFIMVGDDKKANATFVDSEVYQFNGIYKLAQPTTDQSQTDKTVLSNELGYIAIDLGSENKARLDASYSESNIYNYRIYNNKSGYATTRSTSYISISDQRSENAGIDTLYYEPGVTNLDVLNADFTYKDTENEGSVFSVALMGSTVTNIEYQVEEEVLEEGEVDDGYNSSYYLRTFKRFDDDGTSLIDFNIALRSSFATLDAHMLSDMGVVEIKDSVLSWSEVKTSAVDPTLSVETPVYRIGVLVYDNTPTEEEEETETDAAEELVYYTTKTYFDFTKIENDLLEISENAPLIKVTIQAMALQLSETEQTDGCVALVEGGFAYGNAVYLDVDGIETTTLALISNGTTVDGITRFNSVENLCVIDGRLTWNFTAEESLSLTAFTEKYGFEVVQKVDGEENIVSGTFTINEVAGVYTVTFIEDKGAMLAGESTFVVYAMQGTGTEANGIKSFATTLDAVVKLAEITNDDFEIVSDVDYETIDFTEYFVNNADNEITMTVDIGGVVSEIVFTASQSKLYIFTEAPEDVVNYGAGYVNTYLVINNENIGKLTFAVSNALTNTIYSDVSDEFILQRSSWDEENEITWDEDEQVFSWEYNYNSFTEDKTLRVMELAYETSKATTLYTDEHLQEPSEYSLASGEGIFVISQTATVTTILHNDELFYIANNCVAEKYLNKGITLQQTSLYKDELLSEVVQEDGFDVLINSDEEVVILQSGSTATKVLYDENIYYVATAILKPLERVFEVGTLFKFVQENGTEAIICDEDGVCYKVDLSTVEINRPEYTVVATYGEEGNEVVRIYTTTETTFKPTIIGPVTISVSVKLGTTNVQSKELVFDGTANFDLFASGAGTASSPYAIITAQHLKNIQYRLAKDTYLQTYYQEGLAELSGDGEQFYFSLSNDISLTGGDKIDGILFSGSFEGVLLGNDKQITYFAEKTETLTENITISEGNVVGATNYDTSTTFARGAALFETLSAKAMVSNLKISAKFAEVTTATPNHTLVAALAIKNNGQINNVTVVNFESKLFGDGASKIVIAYGGLVAVNSESSGKILSSKTTTKIKLDDESKPQLIFVGGIAYANLAGGLIDGCEMGSTETNYEISVTCRSSSGTVQIAGIAVTNSTSSTIQNCVNKATLAVNSEVAENNIQVYMAGIACYGKGTTLGNTSTATTSNGGFTTFNINEAYLKVGDLFAVV